MELMCLLLSYRDRVPFSKSACEFGGVARNHARVARETRRECEGLARRLLNNFVSKSRPRKGYVFTTSFLFSFFIVSITLPAVRISLLF